MFRDLAKTAFVFLALALPSCAGSSGNSTAPLPGAAGGGGGSPASGGTSQGGTGSGGAVGSGGVASTGGASTAAGGSGGSASSGTGGISATGGTRKTSTGGARSTGGAQAGGSSAGGSTVTGVDGGASTGPLSTKVATKGDSDWGTVKGPLPVNYFIGAWTKVFPPMGSGTKGNDNIFWVDCTEYFIKFVAGNMYSAGSYNGNTERWTTGLSYIGDYAGFLYPEPEAVARDWVYIGWHFKRSGSNTISTAYVKLGGLNAPTKKAQQDTETVNYTPQSLHIGGGHVYNGFPIYMQYVRVYAVDDTPTADWVDQVALKSATPDPNAWGDWPLIAGSTEDVSGNGHTITITGSWYPGVAGPALAK